MGRTLNRIISAALSACLALGVISSVANVRVNAEERASGAVLAFPGAVGGGKYATGGRGGEVVHVTNLNDSGEGSFREAVSKSGRIVVFDVSGTIELKGNIVVSNNITIAGQTAPGGSGITLKNYKLGMGGDNIICRFISSRPGPYMSTSSGNDAWGGAKGSNSIIDHCSMSWASDEQWGLYSNNEYYTVQYCVIGPADSWGGHKKGIHGYGIMMGNGYLTFDHNLIVHNVSRVFRGKIPGTKTADFTNNVIYNWASDSAYGTIGHLNYVNNTLKKGNATTKFRYIYVDSTTSPENFKIYLNGNRMLNQDNSVDWYYTGNNWAGVTYKAETGRNEGNVKSYTSFETYVNGENVSTALTCESADAAYEHVLSYAGNGISPELRTAIDKQVAYETRTGTGNLSGTAAYSDADSDEKANIDKYNIQCSTVYEYPEPVLEKTIIDSDNDGMPDEWEIARGLDPFDPSDTNGDYCGQGYTNIEYYINDLTVDAFPAGVVTLSPTLTYIPTLLDVNSAYMIKSQSSGLYLERNESLSVSALNCEKALPTNTWRYIYEKGGYASFISQYSDDVVYALEVSNNGTLRVSPYDGSDSQLFKITEASDGSYTIRTKASSETKCLDALSAGEALPSSQPSQKWTFEKADTFGCEMDTDISYSFKNGNKYIAANSLNVSLSDSSQLWQLEYVGGGYYSIYTIGADNEKIYVSSITGGNITTAKSSRSGAQLFKFLKNTDGSYLIVSKTSRDSLCIGVVGASLYMVPKSGMEIKNWSVDKY